jgi:DNA-binding NarL/FixJ family response regulator
VAVRIVLIEDHQALREGLQLLLDREGCSVVGSAGGARDGRALVRALGPDVAVVDIRLGDGDGIELTRALLYDNPALGVVLYTGSNDVELLLDGLDSGALGYALKDGPPSELIEAIRRAADGDTWVDPRLRPALLSKAATKRVPTLSAREREIMALLAQGATGDQVAAELFLSAETVKTHIRNAVTKLEARNRVHAIALALRAGEISLPRESRTAGAA